MNPENASVHDPAQSGTVRLRWGNDHADVALHGAQVLSWHCGGRERLYLSPRAVLAPGRAIRGGVPVIFPQFSDRGGGPRHGFARLRGWELAPGKDTFAAHLALRDDDDSRRDWPHSFRAELAVTLRERCLSIALQITNTGAESLAFTGALHTYFRVDDLTAGQLQGLEHRPYLDATRGGAEAVQPDAPLRFEGEIDRIYPDAPTPLLLSDGLGSLGIEQSGFPDTVVWNPGAVLAAKLGDLGPGEHAHFVCVEAARVATPVQLAPGATWAGRQVLTVLP